MSCADARLLGPRWRWEVVGSVEFAGGRGVSVLHKQVIHEILVLVDIFLKGGADYYDVGAN